MLAYHPKLKIFLDVKDDDNYDEEGGNQPEKNKVPWSLGKGSSLLSTSLFPKFGPLQPQNDWEWLC